MGKKHSEDKYDLIRYHSHSRQSVIGRVAPCLDDMVRKLEVVRCCCDLMAMEPDGEGDIKEGMSRIIREVIDELYEASMASRQELKRARKRASDEKEAQQRKEAVRKEKGMTIYELIEGVHCEIQGAVEVRLLNKNSRDLDKIFSSEIGLSGIPDDIAQMRILYLCSEPRSNGDTVIVIDVGQ